MTELERWAMLGDKDAQLECTEKGIVLPCPVCGNMAYTRNSGIDRGRGYINSGDYCTDWVVECSYCGYKTNKYSTELLFNRVSGELSVKGKDGRISAIEKWNTRPAPPIGRCEECRHYRSVFSLDKEDGMRCVREKYTRETKNTDFCSYFEPKEREENEV